MEIYTNKIDHLHPETRAMIQCFYSRSTMSICDRLENLGETEEKIRQNLKKYYVGYGHSSIAECASITIFFENISMLAEKAIQDSPLYIGQAQSTRYIDYSKQDFICPIGANPIFYDFWSKRFRSFYIEILPLLEEDLKAKYLGEGKVYEKAVKAKAFDIARGFLPAGFATCVAWTGSFRSIGEHLRKLLNHPFLELRELALETYNKVKADYPNSFRELRESDYFENKYFYNLLAEPSKGPTFVSDYRHKKDLPPYEKHNPLFRLPRIDADFSLDFASYRDLQRHRNMIQFHPILTTQIGFEKFYIDNLPESVKGKAEELLKEFAFSVENFEGSVYDKQYAIPMGFLCTVLCNFDIHQAVYLTELRSQPTVHPTLRVWAQELGKFLEKEFDIKARVNYDEDTLSLKRGGQDITKKQDI